MNFNIYLDSEIGAALKRWQVYLRCAQRHRAATARARRPNGVRRHGGGRLLWLSASFGTAMGRFSGLGP